MGGGLDRVASRSDERKQQRADELGKQPPPPMDRIPKKNIRGEAAVHAPRAIRMR